MANEIGCIHNRSKTEVWMCGRCGFSHVEALRLATKQLRDAAAALRDPSPVARERAAEILLRHADLLDAPAASPPGDATGGAK